MFKNLVESTKTAYATHPVIATTVTVAATTFVSLAAAAMLARKLETVEEIPTED